MPKYRGTRGLTGDRVWGMGMGNRGNQESKNRESGIGGLPHTLRAKIDQAK